MVARNVWPIRRAAIAKDRLRFRIRRRRFSLFVISAAQERPGDRSFGTLDSALQAFDAMADEWKPSTWLIEYRRRPTFDESIAQNVVHIENGERMTVGSEPEA